jgi:hypothetical protein
MDRRAAVEKLGVAPGASPAEIEAAYRRKRAPLEERLAATKNEVQRTAMRDALVALEAARDALVGGEGAKAPPKKAAAPSAGGAPAPEGGDGRKKLWIGVGAGVVLVGVLVWFLLPGSSTGGGTGRAREAEVAHAKWNAVSSGASPEAAADAAEAEKALAAGSAEKARDLWRRATKRAGADAQRIPVKAAAERWTRWRAPDDAPTTSLKTAESDLAAADKAYDRGAFDEAQALYAKARGPIVAAAESATRGSVGARVTALERARGDASSRRSSALQRIDSAVEDAAHVVDSLEHAEDLPAAQREAAIPLRRARRAAALRDSFQGPPPPDAWKPIADGLARARKAASAGKADEAVAAADDVEKRLAEVLKPLDALDEALAPPPRPPTGDLVGEWTLDPTPVVGAKDLPPEVAKALQDASLRLVTASDGTFSIEGTHGKQRYSSAGTWAPGSAPGTADFTTYVVEREAATPERPWGVPVALLGSRTFAMRGADAVAALVPLDPFWTIEREAAAEPVRALGEKSAALAAASVEATKGLEEAKHALAAAEGTGLRTAQSAWLVAAAADKTAAFRRTAFEAQVIGDPAHEAAQRAYDATRKAAPGKPLLDAIATLRAAMATLAEREKTAEPPKPPDLKRLSGRYAMAMDSWMAPEPVKAAVKGTDVQLDLAEDGNFTLSTTVNEQTVSLGGRWSIRGGEDVSLESRVVGVEPLAEARPWGDTFVRLNRAKATFGIKSDKFNAPNPWLEQVQPVLPAAEKPVGKPFHGMGK